MKDIKTFLQGEGPIFTDGAMGSELMHRGGIVPGGISNMECPEIVSTIHREYIEAGAELILTNTFSMNPIYAAMHAPNYDFREINREGARIAGKRRQGKPMLWGTSVLPGIDGTHGGSNPESGPGGLSRTNGDFSGRRR